MLFKLITLLFAVSLLANESVLPRETAAKRGATDGKKTAKPKADIRTLALDSCYATSGQKGIKPILSGTEAEPHARYFTAFLAANGGMGASNVFLVWGNNLSEVVEATGDVFLGGRSASKPARARVKKDGDKLWLVVYFGIAREKPPQWLVHAVESDGQTIRVRYSDTDFGKKGAGKPPPLAESRPYYLWVPLEAKERDVQALELFDTERDEVSFSRKVKVEDE